MKAARVVIVGGRGNFGVRITRALSGDAGIEVLTAGRGAGSDLQLDLASADFADRLRAASPQIVIHCAGPFQGQDYRVAKAALAAGAHYIDVADGRAFVARFGEQLNGEARAAGCLALSGASTLPALSAAVLDHFAPRFRTLEEVRIAIAPGQRAPRGAATLKGVFTYAGKSFKWLRGGEWRDAWGWQELTRLRFAQMGTRWAAACDVPDLELVPLRHPGVRTVEFRAALELSIQHFFLWLAAGLRRIGLPLPLERWAMPLDRVASLFDGFGGKHGGMLVSLVGTRVDGARHRLDWHLTAPARDGPEIPCMAAILLARKLARGLDRRARRVRVHGLPRVERIRARVRALADHHRDRGVGGVSEGLSILKVAHILSAAVILGTGFGIAFFTWFGYRSALRTGEIGVLRAILRLTVVADAFLTAPAVAFQVVSGIALMTMFGWPLVSPWSIAVWSLFLIAGGCWLPVLKLQVMLRDEAERAASPAALPARFHVLFKWWFALGIPAFAAVLAIYWLMVAKPLAIG